MDGNLKSDVEAKNAFVIELLRRGYETAKVTGSPADITASRNSETFYFEIKYTGKTDEYFGAATLTEWAAALAFENQYRFVVARKRDKEWVFHEYTPAEFMEFSSIPPFKIFFHVPVGDEKAVNRRHSRKRVRLTREKVKQMVELFQLFRPM